MSRNNNIKSGLIDIYGFTLVEALVAMAVFMIGFGGLYFFYGISQEVVQNSEKKMNLNLIADQIVQTVAAGLQTASTDPLNPISHPEVYASTDLNECVDTSKKSGFSTPKEEWSCSLISAVGRPREKDVRSIELIPSGNSLVVNVWFVIDNGNISVSYTRKLRQL